MYCQRWFFALVLASGFVSASANARQFDRPHYYGIGAHRGGYGVVATHLTRSGNLDLVVSDFFGGGGVSILLGNGDGTFQKPIILKVSSPDGIAAGDFNEDGNQDLAVVEYGGNGDGAVAIFLGDGTGHFKPAGTYTMGVGTVMVAVSDFNKDGHLDLAVSNAGNDNGVEQSVMTLFGDGHGGFSKLKTYLVKAGAYPYGIAAGDLNGDGYPDVAVTTGLGDSVAVFLNDGTGKFGKPAYYGVRGHPIQVSMADLRNNGSLDLVAADPDAGMDVWLNNGDGTFGEAAVYIERGSPYSCTVADFNGDNKPDVACSSHPGYAYWFRGNGDGTFKPAVEIRDGNPNYGSYSLTSGDFNGDGAPDLAIQIAASHKVTVMLNAK